MSMFHGILVVLAITVLGVGACALVAWKISYDSEEKEKDMEKESDGEEWKNPRGLRR